MTAPYYQDDSVTLHHGEALAVLAELPNACVDAVITDPPYSSGGQVRGDRMGSARSKYVSTSAQHSLETFGGDNRDQRSYQYWCALWLAECLRVTKPGGVLAIGTAARGARVRQPSGSTWGTSGPVDLLPTPSAADGNGGRQRSREALDSGDHQVNLTDLPRLLLPTPTSRDHKGAANPPGRLRDGRARTTGDDMLPDAVMALLPTPRTTDAKGSGAHGAGGPDLRTVVTTGIEWGKYEPVIRRWEAITREAPSPTELGTKGNPRLAAPFSEWMQGWPLGWVTDIAISRSAMLRIIGNGVVPQQAIAALYWLLSVSEVAA